MATKRPKQPPKSSPVPDYDPLTGLPPPTVPSMLGVQEAPGAEKKPARLRGIPGQERGVPGLKHWFGRLYEEWMPALADEKGKRAYLEMAWNEPSIVAFRYVIEMLVRQVQFEVEPFDESLEETEWAEFVDSCLHDMESPWASVVADALTMIIYGWGLQEKVFKLRKGRDGEHPSNHNDGRLGWLRLAPRSQETIWRWELDPHGKVLGVIQWAPPAWQFTQIPIDALIHYKTHEWHSSPEGVSLLRGAYVPFQFKKTIQTIEAIAIERDGCGIPVVRMPAERMRLATEESDTEEGQGAKAQLDSLIKLARDLKTDSQQGIVMPSEFDEGGHQLYDVSLMSSAGGRTIGTDQVIRRYKEEMFGAVNADFLAFGHETTGTQALGATRSDMFLTAVNALVACITGPFNRQVIPELCEMNGKKEKFPTLGHTDLQEANLGVLTPYLATLAQLGIDLSDSQTERHLRRIADLPVPSIEGGK